MCGVEKNTFSSPLTALCPRKKGHCKNHLSVQRDSGPVSACPKVVTAGTLNGPAKGEMTEFRSDISEPVSGSCGHPLPHSHLVSTKPACPRLWLSQNGQCLSVATCWRGQGWSRHPPEFSPGTVVWAVFSCGTAVLGYIWQHVQVSFFCFDTPLK